MNSSLAICLCVHETFYLYMNVCHLYESVSWCWNANFFDLCFFFLSLFFVHFARLFRAITLNNKSRNGRNMKSFEPVLYTEPCSMYYELLLYTYYRFFSAMPNRCVVCSLFALCMSYTRFSPIFGLFQIAQHLIGVFKYMENHTTEWS